MPFDDVGNGSPAFSPRVEDRQFVAAVDDVYEQRDAVRTIHGLHLSVDTIETQIRNAMRKLGAHLKTHATALAVAGGIIDLSS